MSSGFVSGGTIDEPAERDDEWRRVQEELEEERRRKAEMGRQEGGKSLYEVLQQNKMAKQEAFEESIRLKNQFRALDEDEVEFLDSLLESTRAKEAAIKRETAEQLAAFQRQREEADRALLESATSGENHNPAGGEEEQWTISGRKRKRSKKDLLFPTKVRRVSTADTATPSSERKVSLDATRPPGGASNQKEELVPPPSSTSPPSKIRTDPKPLEDTPPAPQKREENHHMPHEQGKKSPDRKESELKAAPPPPSLGLVAYSSDEE
ncbi:hypothetical protein VTN77DRAFT_4475 [Rasamsonia byssochlamydoides]|uniref:uncharacterized protein n=1 Tax=Rasamsonia byssochlamydoides TaxID=89139 RepID=UPI0037433673